MGVNNLTLKSIKTNKTDSNENHEEYCHRARRKCRVSALFGSPALRPPSRCVLPPRASCRGSGEQRGQVACCAEASRCMQVCSAASTCPYRNRALVIAVWHLPLSCSYLSSRPGPRKRLLRLAQRGVSFQVQLPSSQAPQGVVYSLAAVPKEWTLPSIDVTRNDHQRVRRCLCAWRRGQWRGNSRHAQKSVAWLTYPQESVSRVCIVSSTREGKHVRLPAESALDFTTLSCSDLCRARPGLYFSHTHLSPCYDSSDALQGLGWCQPPLHTEKEHEPRTAHPLNRHSSRAGRPPPWRPRTVQDR